jgi:hypothetical protein
MTKDWIFVQPTPIKRAIKMLKRARSCKNKIFIIGTSNCNVINLIKIIVN